jgi:hypothetical protein
MPEISKREKQLDWVCRILITIDLYITVSGYISYFQTKRQLVSPLIPKSTLYDISEIYMKAGLITGIGLMAGLWLYFFKKRIAAIILLCLAMFSYELVFLFLKM